MERILIISLSCIIIAGYFPATTALQCYECLAIECESSTICESIKLSMARIFYPKRHYIEFNPNDTCPDQIKLLSSTNTNINQTNWNQVSHECSKSDSVCFEATIEVVTIFNGLKNSLELEKDSTMKSKGVVRGCASRRFLLGQPEEYVEVKAEQVNDTLGAVTNNTNKSKDSYTITEIQSHHFYIDHGTDDAMKCYETNCNRSKRFDKNSSNSLNNNNNYLGLLVNVILFLIYKM